MPNLAKSYNLSIFLYIICGWFGRCPIPPLPPTPAPAAQATAESPASPEPEQLTSLVPWSFPWSPAGMNDAGYCPLVDGWGWNGSLLWPVEGYTEVRPFGWLGPGRGYHAGTDIYAPVGTPVLSPVSGVIVWRGGNSAGYGNKETGMVAVASSGRVVILGHLSAVSEGLACGDDVTAGVVIGAVGCSGACSRPHVHMEIRFGLAWDAGLWLP